MRTVHIFFPGLRWLPALVTGLVFLAAARPSGGQSSSSDPESIQIRLHAQDLDAPTALEEAVMNAFRMSFRSRGVETGPSQIVLHVSATTYTTDDGTRMGLLSVAEAQRLGKKMVDAGAEHEIWYAGRNVTSFTPEAREIRQYVTREMLEGATHMHAMRTKAFALSDVNRAVESCVADFWERHTRSD